MCVDQEISNKITTVHPVPAPFSTNELSNNKIKAGGNNQKDILFNRGKAINFVIIRLFILIS